MLSHTSTTRFHQDILKNIDKTLGNVDETSNYVDAVLCNVDETLFIVDVVSNHVDETLNYVFVT